MYGGYRNSPPLTNNPFIAGSSHPSSRFPDISTPPNQQQQYSSWGDGSMMAASYPQQQQQQQGIYQQQQYPQQQFQTSSPYGQTQPQQQLGMGGGYTPQSYSSQQMQVGSPTPASFQPLSSFGQQLAAAHVSGSSYGYLQGQQQPQQNNSGYNPAQQQLQNNPGYMAQFDPYSSIAQGWDGQNGNNNSGGMSQRFNTGSTTSSSSFSTSGPGSNSTAASSYGLSSTGDPHPRDYIRTHKTAIEAWDNYSWKQLLSSFETLMRAWDTRKGDLAKRLGELSAQMQFGGYYVAQIQQEGARIQGLQREAESNVDSVTASTFQMKEVFSGYRQSGDLASKSRVREAMNASLQGLPGWPQPY